MIRDHERGQMNKWARLRNLIHGADVIVEVVDARDSQGTRLPVAEKWAGVKRLLILANKADLLHEGAKPKLPPRAVLASATKSDNAQRLALIKIMVSKSEVRPVKALFIGYPNVGKSTLINMLSMRHAARVSEVAGTTRDMQWIRVSPDLLASDYRGMFPKSEKHDVLVRKSAINVSGEEEAHAYRFAERILKSPKLKAWCEKRFDIRLEGAMDAEAVLRTIAQRRKFYLKKGELDLQNASRVLFRAMRESPEI